MMVVDKVLLLVEINHNLHKRKKKTSGFFEKHRQIISLSREQNIPVACEERSDKNKNETQLDQTSKSCEIARVLHFRQRSLSGCQ
jgi:ABC-type lipopolysaccharide export system ATPase subunit